MAFWRGERLLANGSSLIIPFSDKQIDCNAYVLRMGDRYFRTSEGEAPTEEDQKKILLAPEQSFVIPPGQFAYLLTKETVNIPTNAMAFISMRTQIKFEGLINVSGFHVDPGYEGKLLYAVFNASPSPIPISENDLLFKIWFCDLDDVTPAAISPSRFVKNPAEGVYDIDNRLIHGMSPPIVSLQGLAEKQKNLEQMLARLRADIDGKFEAQKPTLDSLSFVWRGLNIAALTAIIGAALGLVVSYGYPLASRAGVELADYILPIKPPTQPTPPRTTPHKPATARP